MQSEKRPAGRPRKADSEKLEQRSIRMPQDLWRKIEAGGGVKWLRAVVRRAKWPKGGAGDKLGDNGENSGKL